MTPSFMISVLKGEGFEVTYQDAVEGVLPNKNWIWRGCIAEKRFENTQHWSKADYRDIFGVDESLFTGNWNFGEKDGLSRLRYAMSRIVRLINREKV